jgi:redox-sensitive bicupin YhaK (pirin superfamily)
MYATLLGAGEAAHHDLKPGRGAWIHVARGSVSLNGTKLQAGDGAALDTPGSLTLDQGQDAEVPLFDMAM